MARAVNKLSALWVAKVSELGVYADGAGLYLQVSKWGTKAWLFRFMLDGRSREMGLGSIRDFTLAEARIRARDARQLLADGIDPIDARRARRAANRLEAARAQTFKDCAEAYIAAHAPGWRNPKHAGQWTATLTTYAFPTLGPLPVATIDTALVVRVLTPIWATKTETASRVRGRIESILDWATAREFRRGDNPARWRGHLDHLLPERGKVQRVQHHPALPYAEVGAFMKWLRAQRGLSAAALEFTILTAARTGEVIGATWDEIDFRQKIWLVPAARMKAGREHRVPLSPAAIAVLERVKAWQREGVIQDGRFVFPGARAGRPLSNMAQLELLRRSDRADVTVHGFRSSFRDWAAERTNYPRDVAEMALAHVIPDKVEAAYRRGDLFEKRRRLMIDWAKFCGTAAPAGVVVPMSKSARGGTA